MASSQSNSLLRKSSLLRKGHSNDYMLGAHEVLRRTLHLAVRELQLLATLLLLAGSLWAFTEVAEEVAENETHAIDTAILLSLRNPVDYSDPLGPGWLEEMVRDITGLGGVGVLTFIATAAVVYLLLGGNRRAAMFVFVSIASGIALSLALKSGFDRPRPDLVPHGAEVYTKSFPSGHSMMSALVYFTLGALLARLQPNRRLKAFVIATAILLALAIGISRVYLGVHWPTDVLAGWAAGAAWALLCWALLLWLQRQHQVEEPDGGQNQDPARYDGPATG